MRLGKNQLNLLFILGASLIVLTPEREAHSLARRGLLDKAGHGSYRINAAGLRVLADAIEAGKLDHRLVRAAE